MFFLSAECAVEDPGSQLNRHHVLDSTGQVVLRRSTEICPAEIRVSGIDGGHCGMLASGMQIFDASVKERI